MRKVFVSILLGTLWGCQQHLPEPQEVPAIAESFATPPLSLGGDVQGLVFKVEGTAPGLLRCTLENKSPIQWDFIGYPQAPSKSITYWNGTNWQRPHMLGCGGGTTLQQIEPGEVFKFREYAMHSYPKIEISMWRSFFDQESEVVLVASPVISQGEKQVIPTEWN